MMLSLSQSRNLQDMISIYADAQSYFLRKIDGAFNQLNIEEIKNALASSLELNRKTQDDLEEAVTKYTGTTDPLIHNLFYEGVREYLDHQPERLSDVIERHKAAMRHTIGGLEKYSHSLICCVPPANDDVY